jgi:hypothetical protein
MEAIDFPGPPTIRGVLSRMWRIGHARWPVLLLAAVVIFVPVGLLEALDEELQEPLTDPELDIDRLIEIVIAAFVFGAGMLLGDVLYAGVVAAAVIAERTRHQGSLRELLQGLPVLRLIAADLLLGAIVVIGFLLLIVPAFIFITWFALVGPVVKIEHPPLRAAFRRSRDLVRGHFWLVFLFVIPIVIVAEALSGLATTGTVELLGEGFVGDWAGASVTELLTAPVYALGVVVLYFELREAARSGRAA